MKVGVDLAAVRDRLKTFVPAIGFNAVQGAAELEAALKNGLLTTPSAFVIPMAEAPAKNAFEFQSVSQDTTAMCGVVVAVRDLSDAVGEAAMATLRSIRGGVFDALVNWTSDPDFAPFVYGGGQVIGQRDQITLWQDDFITEYLIRA